ncbi:MAG: hypothetical protein PHN82_12310 [bacterium]|nr:hypothetical protein [bacterium]
MNGYGTAAAVLAACLLACPARAQVLRDPKALAERGARAAAAGDKVAAIGHYTEAINEARAANAPPEGITQYLIARDRLVADIVAQVSEVYRRQSEVLILMRGIAQQMARISEADKDIQDRVKDNEERIRDIESTLLDAIR